MTTVPPVIAIIDDDLDVRSATAALVASHGYRIEQYSSGTRFLAHATKSAAACLILDGQLGDMSGIELALHLARLGLEFPIVFLTGSDNAMFREQAAELNFVAYLRKPVPVKSLMDSIAAALKP